MNTFNDLMLYHLLKYVNIGLPAELIYLYIQHTNVSQWYCGKKIKVGRSKFQIESLFMEYFECWLYYIIVVTIVCNVEEPTSQ